MPDALELLKTRRSVKPIELAGPGPTASEIETLLRIASRVPDHGKLAPWRFILFEGDARAAAGEAIASVFRADRPDATPDQINFERNRLARAPLVIAVVSRAGPHVKIPEWEQEISAGASAMSLVFAAHAMAMPRAGSPSGMPMIAACSMPLAFRRMNGSPVSCTSGARQSPLKTANDQI